MKICSFVGKNMLRQFKEFDKNPHKCFKQYNGFVSRTGAVRLMHTFGRRELTCGVRSYGDE